MRIRLFTALIVLVLTAAFGTPAHAQAGPSAAPTSHIEVSQLPPAGVASFDPIKATNAYLAEVSPKDRARSDAYFEGGYYLLVVDLVYTLVVAGLLLWLKISARMRDIAAGITRYRWLQVPIYAVQYLIVTTFVSLPLTIYENFYREHQYGLSNQTFVQWAGDFGIGLLQNLVLFTILLTIIYAIARAVQRRWWVWGTAITVVFMAIVIMIGPVFLAPMFNHYSPLPDSAMKSAILSMARANGIPATDVYTFDASRQSKRISANVSGLLGTTRISLNDNLLDRCTPSEVLAVLGHEMGHYVMNHVAVLLTWFGLLALVAFWFVDKSFHGLVSWFGGNWDVRSIDDPAGLPLVMALISVFFFLATPITNTIVRTQEVQADIFGLNAVRQPDAFATVVLKLGEYRKLDPTPLEEFVFFDHPSGRTRIWEAMRWKKEHINDPDIMAGPISPQ
jgi:Zn-dependent protease with chaperone function